MHLSYNLSSAPKKLILSPKGVWKVYVSLFRFALFLTGGPNTASEHSISAGFVILNRGVTYIFLLNTHESCVLLH
jgi:hypothetical protein